ncbi:heparinase II/III family protein [Termitidicoccus mucosus]|uniref:Heparinase II/III-like C-terminal domain-containing protein n=1 Tax=Termitidicoccus mucosus TaxID=1184151 RepID=A0A178ILG1_9BACT|nr:hypothetical protein AW736_07600 [Opitutaceae bacterium TSB47]
MKPHSVPFLVLLLSSVPLCAEYRIGEKEIPSVKIHSDAADFAVHPSHPRLFFRDTDIPTIRTRIAGEYQTEWRQMLHHLEEVGLSQRPGKFAVHPHLKSWEIVRNIAFVAAVTGEERYIKWSKEWAAIMADAGPVGNDTEFRGRLQCLAIAYDWLFPWLSADEKQALEKAILAHIDRSWYFATQSTNYVGGHSRWGNFALTAGLLALVTEHPELREKLLLLRRHWLEGYFPAQGWIARDGGYHMGWSYSAAYLTASIHYVWSTATNESVFFPWQAKIPWFWIYGRQGDGTYANTGDAYTVTDDLNAYQSDLLILAAGVLKEPRAAWALKDRTNRFADILYQDKSVRPLAPDDPAAPLELSRHFRNAGVVIARDRWDGKTTLLNFASTPFFATNHLHRDANAFTLHYRGSLAVDSGIYDEGGKNAGGYGGTHWRNYFTRTIAHNAITVFDPAQKMFVLDEPASNDGGQVFRQEPTKLADIQPGGHAHLDGIVHYVATDDYTYAVGDATKAYDAERVRLAQREIVYLRAAARGHPVVVVYDRVESVKAEFQKRFLLHTINKPVVRGNLAVAENQGGRLSCLTLLPEKAGLALIGGPGKEAWVDGKNYPWDETAKKRRSRELAQWRLEVSPREARLRDDFLHVLFVDDAGAPVIDAKEAALVQSGDNAGVEVAGWRILFSRDPGRQARIERLR